MPKRIAIIEDDYAIQQMYRYKLEESGYDVRTANNGVEGLELTRDKIAQWIHVNIDNES